MKTSVTSFRPSTSRALILAALAAIGLASHAGAQTTTISWTTTSPTGDSGNWSDTTKWTGGDIPDGFLAGGPTTRVENANFGVYANNRTITLDNSYSINGLSISPVDSGSTGKTFTLSTANSSVLTLGAGGFTQGSGSSISISVGIVLAVDQTWTTPTITTLAPTTFSNVISGPGKITRTTGSGATGTIQLTLSGANTFAGGFVQNVGGGTIYTRLGSSSVLDGSGNLLNGAFGTGTVTLNTGIISSNSNAGPRTIQNNVVIGGNMTFGDSTNNSGLTFSDTGLTTATTFTLGSATSGNVTRIRTPNTALTFDQVITESGGTGQSIQFAATTSGTPTVTIGRTKTATGNVLTGGVNLVLNNGAANSGSLIGVNGSITATGSNKFSSGSLISDNTALVATDAANYSLVAGGKATVYNNGRASFATDQTQATVAGLFTSDSQVRLGLGSGAASTTVTENYNQSAIGNGFAGLVSASTVTVTYNGTLTAGTDSTYRVGGGLGTLALGTALTGANALSVEGGGTLTSTSNNTYTGATTINGTTATISGTAGALSGTSAVTVNNGGTLNLTNTTALVNADRIGNAVPVTLNSAQFALNGTSTTAIAETVGNLTVNSGGRNFITIAQTPAASTVKTLQFGTLTRANNAVAVFRGDSLGGTGTARNEIKFSAAPTLIGGGGAAASNTISIIPWARGGTAAANQATTFVTYETNGVRALTTAEFVQANNDTTARIDQAIATAGGATNYNVRSIPNTIGNATLVNTASSTLTLNSLLFDNTGNTNNAGAGGVTYSLNSSTINVTSGAVHINHTASQNIVLGTGTLAFGSAEGVITNNANGFLTTLNTTLTGSGGLSLYVLNTGGIQIGGTNSVSGGITIGGNGSVGVSNDAQFGNSSNTITHAGGELRFYGAFTSTRDITLLANVGNNTLGNNTTSSTVTLTGNITGAGLLRLVNNASTVGTGGFSLGGATSSYSGGTQIEGIAVSGTTNSALGTGTVTLIGANGNAASLSLTGSAPVLGGLRGTDGTVTISPTVGTTSTLDVGSNNDNTVFNGVIAQGSGKVASLTKSGSGTLVLGNNNTYTGLTQVNAGKLLVNGSLAGTAAVSNAGTILGGTGTITGAVTVGSGAILLGGNGGPVGALTLTAVPTLSSGSILELALGALNSHSTIALSGGFNGFNANQDFTFLNLQAGTYDNIITGVASSIITSGWTVSGSSGFTYSFTDDGTNIDLNITAAAVPEPSTWVGAGLITGLAAWSQRKRLAGLRSRV